MASKGDGLGVAFDIGSTTLAGALVEPGSGEVLAVSSAVNPQVKWGGDILSRVRAVTEDTSLLSTLQSELTATLSDIIKELTSGHQGKPVTELTAAGNSVMEHILLGVSPQALGKVPYKPVFKEARLTPAAELGITGVAEGAMLYTFPLIGGFIGGDTTAVLLTLDALQSKKTTLMIDVGTNSESALMTGGVIYAASAPAGPAFEGGEIGFGMRAAKGAIEGVSVTADGLAINVIGGGTPVGICGSGLLEAIAGLLEANVIDPTGRIKGPEEIETNIAASVVEGSSEEGNSVTLFRGPKGAIILTQADIRSFQTAKSAIRSGVDILIKKAGLSTADIDEVCIAGTFGSHLKKEGLERTGVLEVCWHDKIRFVGDATLDGAVLALADAGAKEGAELIAKDTKYVSLSGSKHFEKMFLKNMNF